MDIITQWNAYEREVHRRSPRTVSNYRPAIEQLVAWGLANSGDADDVLTAISKLDRMDVVAFLRRPNASGNLPTPPLWNMRLAAVRSFLGYLVETEAITMNVAIKIERQNVFSQERIPLGFDELIRLVDAVRENSEGVYRARNVAMTLALIHCAMRVAELVSLNVEQVDFEHYLFLNTRVKGGKLLAIGFNDVVAEALEAYLTERVRLHPCESETALFLSDRGTRISKRAVQEMVHRMGKLAGITIPVTPHILRHSSATRLTEVGVQLRVVQEICGHASVTTTQRYVHVERDEKKRAVEKLGARWKEEVEKRAGK